MMNRPIKQVCIVFLCFTALILLPGCAAEQAQKTPMDTTVSEPESLEQAELKQAEQSEVQDAEPVENLQAEQKLAFAQNRLSLAQKGIMGYSQTVVLCRDVIKQYPGTQYERQAKALLGQVPEDLRSQFNITDEELGL